MNVGNEVSLYSEYAAYIKRPFSMRSVRLYLGVLLDSSGTGLMGCPQRPLSTGALVLFQILKAANQRGKVRVNRYRHKILRPHTAPLPPVCLKYLTLSISYWLLVCVGRSPAARGDCITMGAALTGSIKSRARQEADGGR